MHLDVARVASVGLLLLGACAEPARPVPSAAVQVAGGESSEFGGSLPLGYCPEVVTRTPLDLESEGVAAWVALVAGHHDVPMRWRRGFPDDAIRGFEERTELSFDITPIAAEDVLCSNGTDGPGGYETEGLVGRRQRHFEVAIELSTTDGAVRASWQQFFFPLLDVNFVGERLMLGGTLLPFEEAAGTLELGVDPELGTDTQTLSVAFTFDEHSVQGSLVARVSLPGPVLGDDTPSWEPVIGAFPAPDEGCEVGHIVPLDASLDSLGGTPRAAYEAAVSRFPSEPITAAWEDPLQPRSLTWTEVTLGAGVPTHACLEKGSVDVYTSLRIDSQDGLVTAEPSVVARVSSRSEDTLGLSMSGVAGWTPRAEFVATAGIRDLDLGMADYGGFSVRQTLGMDDGAEKLDGELNVAKWEDYFARPASPVLRWCAGAACEMDWCLRTATDDGSSCL